MHIRRQLFVTMFLGLFALPAFAYIDPNTGGYLYQLLAPLVAIAISAWMFLGNQVKALWRSLRRIFSREMNQEK